MDSRTPFAIVNKTYTAVGAIRSIKKLQGYYIRVKIVSHAPRPSTEY